MTVLNSSYAITAELLREILVYEPCSGSFLWKISSGRAKAGDVAGYAGDLDYRSIQIFGRAYCAHRLAWLHVHGIWPADEIDHINGVRGDNRLVNLRSATTAENRQNHAVRRDNTSKFPGVNWDKYSGKWRVRIRVPGRRLHVGLFKRLEDAVSARAEAKAKLHTFQPFDRGVSP